MRLIASLLFATLVACGARGGGDPAWPKRLDPEVDGGESLAPRTASVIAEADKAEKDTKTEEKVETKADDAKADDKDTPDDDAKPSATTPAATDDIIIIDDIVIEIED